MKTVKEKMAEAIRYELEKSTVRGSKYDNAAEAAFDVVVGKFDDSVLIDMVEFAVFDEIADGVDDAGRLRVDFNRVAKSALKAAADRLRGSL